jgi:hypothetical protein
VIPANNRLPCPFTGETPSLPNHRRHRRRAGGRATTARLPHRSGRDYQNRLRFGQAADETLVGNRRTRARSEKIRRSASADRSGSFQA